MIIDNLILRYIIDLTEFFNLMEFIKCNNNTSSYSIGIVKDSIYQNAYSIKFKNNKHSSIFIGHGNKKNLSLRNALFFKFNPAKCNKNVQTFIRTIHRYLNREWFVHSLDIAFDIDIEIDDLYVYTTKRKYTSYESTRYYGVRNDNGNLKVYNKFQEIERYDKTLPIQSHLTRIEYTFKSKGKFTSPNELDISTPLQKSYSFHLLSKLNGHEKSFLFNNINNNKKVSKNMRNKLQELKNKSIMPLKINNLAIIKYIYSFLQDKIYCKNYEKHKMNLSFLMEEWDGVCVNIDRPLVVVKQHTLPLLM